MDAMKQTDLLAAAIPTRIALPGYPKPTIAPDEL